MGLSTALNVVLQVPPHPALETNRRFWELPAGGALISFSLSLCEGEEKALPSASLREEEEEEEVRGRVGWSGVGWGEKWVKAAKE